MTAIYYIQEAYFKLNGIGNGIKKYTACKYSI